MPILLRTLRSLVALTSLLLCMMAVNLILYPQINVGAWETRLEMSFNSLITPCFDASWQMDRVANSSFDEKNIAATGTQNTCESKTHRPQFVVSFPDYTSHTYDRASVWTLITSRFAVALLGISLLALTFAISMRGAALLALFTLGGIWAWIIGGMPLLSVQQPPFVEFTSFAKVVFGALVVPSLYWLTPSHRRVALLCAISVLYLYISNVSFEYLLLLALLIAMTWAVLPHPAAKKAPLSPVMIRIITLMLTAFSIGLGIMIPIPRTRPPYEMILLISALCGAAALMLFWTERTLRHVVSQHLSSLPVAGIGVSVVLLFLPNAFAVQLGESVTWFLFLVSAMGLCGVLCGLIRYRASQAQRRFICTCAIFILIILFLTFKWPAYPDPFVVLGFSYMAFRLLHVLLEVRLNREMPIGSLSEWGLYILFFPSQAVGPIDRWSRFLSDLKEEKTFSWGQISAGWQRILWGAVKKFILANILFGSMYPGQVALEATPPLYAWLQLYVYAISLYCDFSGFVDIAIGTAQLLGFHLPENFDRPYTRGSIAQFWQSWHITLSSWLRIYIFLPFSRALLRTRLKRFPLLIVLIANVVTMSLIGLWHGLTWNFLAWGLWHAVGLFIHKVFSDRTRRTQMAWKNTWRAQAFHVFSVLLTFHFVLLGWVFFSLPTFEDSLRYFALLIGVHL